MDDMVVLGSEKEELHNMRIKVESNLYEKLVSFFVIATGSKINTPEVYMKKLKDVQGSKESAKELIIGKDTVYIHSNIRKIEGGDDDALMGGGEVYIYDEIQMTKDEYLEDIQEKLEIANQALADMMLMMGGMQ